jgi:hypothetical protein
MATLEITLPDRVLTVTVPDGPSYVPITVLECECGCGEWFQPAVPHQKFVDEAHQKATHNARAPRKTTRRQK